MKFTVIFPSHESIDISVGGVFIPCFAWKFKSKNHIPHPRYPHYQEGDFDYLLNILRVDASQMPKNKHLVIVVHPNGHARAGCQRFFKVFKSKFSKR